MKRVFEKGHFRLLAVGLTLGLGLSAARALECPAPPKLADAAQPDLTGQLSSKDVLAQVPGIIGSLHQQFPRVGAPQLVNFLIATYCPIVKDDASLSEDEKQARIREFADRVVANAYSQ